MTNGISQISGRTCHQIFAALVLGLIIWSSQVVVGQTVGNPGFEIPALAAGAKQANPTGAYWTFVGLSGIANNGSVWNAPTAPDGVQVAYMESSVGYTPGTISQTINFAAGTYAITLQAALRSEHNVGPLPITVTVDGATVGTIAPIYNVFTPYATNPFTVTAGNHTVQFIVSNLASYSGNTDFIDSVSIVSTTFANGSFETPALGTAGRQYNPTGASWTFSNQCGIAANGSPWNAPTAPDGTQVCFLQSCTGYTNGSISQTVYFSPGSYALSFQAALRASSNGAISMNVLIDNTLVGSFSPTNTTAFAAFNTNTNPFDISVGGYHTIQFAATGTATNSAIFLDLVGINTVSVTSNTNNSVVNGGFETPNLGTNGKQYDPTGATWTFLNQSGIAANGSAWNPPPAPDGNQVCFLQSSTGGTNGSITQAINFTPGVFTLNYNAALRQQSNTATVTFNVLVDSTVVGTCTPVLNTFNSYSTNPFVISTTGTHTIQFMIPAAPTANNSVFIDSVAMTGLGSGTYKIIAGNSGQALAASGAGTVNNTPVVTEVYDGGTDKQWNVTSLGNGQYTIQGVGSGLYAQINNSGTTAGTPIYLYSWSNQDNYKFTLTSDGNGYYTPISVSSGMAMTVQGNLIQAGTTVEQDPYSASVLDDQWKFLAPTEGETGTSGQNFAMVLLPDTQHEAQGTIGSEPYMYYDQANWINDQASSLNIVYVASMGDIVQIGSDTTEWGVASNALYSLTVPYGTVPGNHDYDYDGSTIYAGTSVSQWTTLNYYNQYFGVSNFSGKSWYGGYESNTPDNNGPENDNHYDLITAGGMNFIIVYMQFHEISDDLSMSTLPADLAWANSVISQYPTRRAIFVTHQLVSGTTAAWAGGYYTPGGEALGQYIYDTLKVNPNLFLMLCGHDADPVGTYRQDTYNGNTITTILSDYQDPDSPDFGGDGIVRYLQFEPAENLMTFQSYCVETGTWRSQFSIPYKMH